MQRYMFGLAILAVAACIVLLNGPVVAAPFSSGGFEWGGGSGDKHSNTALGAWIVGDPDNAGNTSNNDQVYIRDDSGRARSGDYSMTYYGGSRTDMELYQTFDTVPSQTYDVTFSVDEGQSGNSGLNVKVYDGQLPLSGAGSPYRTSDTATPITSTTISDVAPGYTEQRFSFTATGTSTTLVFRGDIPGGGQEIDFDDVSVLPTLPTFGDVRFADNFTGDNGLAIGGKAANVGGPWNQTSGGGINIVDEALNTTGGAREIVAALTQPLESGESLRLQFDSLETPGGNLFSGGFAGISLLEGSTEKLFVGDVANDTVWSIASDANGTDKISSAISDEFTSAVFTYDYNTGEASLSLDRGAPISGFLPANAAIDSLRIWNNGGGDLKIANLEIQVASPVPEPSTFILAALGLLGLVGIRRRRNR